MSYSGGHPGKAKQRMARQSKSIKRSSRGFGSTPSGRAFAWLLTLTSVAVLLAVYLSFRGADEAPQESPVEAGAVNSTPPAPLSGSIESRPAALLPPLPAGPNIAWQPLAIDSVEPERLPGYKEIVEGRVLVELSTGMWSWGEGERIALAVPQIGAVYEPVIERVETMLGNNRSWCCVNLSTPQGSFELVGGTELAWLMPVANMDQHVDYSQPDYYIPGEDFPDESILGVDPSGDPSGDP